MNKKNIAKKMKGHSAAYKKLMADPLRGFKEANTKEHQKKVITRINDRIAKHIVSKY